MTKEQWKVVIEAIGVLSIVASLVFVGMEIRQSSREAADASLTADAATIVELESFVADHSDVWRRGCLGESLTDDEQVVFSRIHHSYVFSFYFRWLRATSGVQVSSAALAVDNTAMNIYRYPGFRQEWEAHGASRQHIDSNVALQVFRALVDERVKEYPSFEPEPLTDVSRCGLI